MPNPLAQPQTPPRAVIFDLDGVIFDSAESNVVFYDHILTALGHPPIARQAFEIIHSEPLDRSLKYLLGEGAEYQRAMAYCRGLDPGPFVTSLVLYEGVTETLEALAGRARLAVATNRTVTCRLALKHFGLLKLFEEVITPIEAGRPKPDPTMMHMTLSRLGLERQEVVYVGDTGVDEGMCQAARVRLLAFRNQGLAAWAHASHFGEIPGLLGLA
ncbi:MAG: HAD family hydrolase [Desulfarculus sp.]|nr:HAD family hydrolase [Desulfarculus sp.]